MAKCAVCGMEVLMPFKCNYCGDYFCAEHRLPEKHSCPGLYAVASPREKEVKIRRALEGREESRWGWPAIQPTRRIILQSEWLHLLIGSLLVTLVGFSLIGYDFRLSPLILGISAMGFIASFLLHELAHRGYARSRGLQARFKLDTLGALLTLVTAIPLIPFKIIAPGVVVISGLASMEVVGMAALVGPSVNLALSACMSIAAYVAASLGWGAAYYMLSRLGALNAFIALFNLIPFGGLDGRKVLAWSPSRWVAALVLSLLMLAISYAI